MTHARAVEAHVREALLLIDSKDWGRVVLAYDELNMQRFPHIELDPKPRWWQIAERGRQAQVRKRVERTVYQARDNPRE